MKKTIISSALRFVPKKIQMNALCKALNYICQGNDLRQFEGKVIKLNVSDLKKSWFVTCHASRFESIKAKVADVEIKTNFNTAVQLQNKKFMLQSIEKGDVELIGEAGLTDAIEVLVLNTNEQRLINLSRHFFQFLKLSPPESSTPPRLNIDNVTLSDLKSPLDVDFIRNEAIKLESRDLKKALTLMLLAQQARPKGPLIAQKVMEYQKKLK